MRTNLWKLDSDRKRIFALIILLLPIFIFSAIQIASSQSLSTSDFFAFWLAGKMNWTNQNPYFIDQWAAAQQQFGSTWTPDAIFPYPIPLAILLAPIGLFTLNQAYIVWVISAEIFIVLSICLLLYAFVDSQKKIHFVLPLMAAAFLFRPTITTLNDGQLGAFFLFVLCLAILFWKGQKSWQAAITLSFLIMKPTIGAPILFFVVVWMVFKKNFKSLAVLIGSGLAWLLIGLLKDVQWIPKFLSIGAGKFTTRVGLFPNIWGISSQACGGQSLCTFGAGGFLALILVGVTIYVLWAKKDSPAFFIVSLITPVSLLITPYIWPYDQVLLIIPVVYVTVTLIQRGYPYLLAALFPISLSILSLGLLLLAVQLNQDTWSVLLPLVCFGLTLALSGTGQKSAENSRTQT